MGISSFALAHPAAALSWLLAVTESPGGDRAKVFPKTDVNQITVIGSNKPDISKVNVGWVRAGARQWSEREIETIDEALGMLVTMTGNNRLLETSTGQELTFSRYGTVWNLTTNTDGTLAPNGTNTSLFAWNSRGGQLGFADAGMAQATASIHTTVLHEIGHNWDEREENRFVERFREVGGWEDFTGRWIPTRHERAQDANWSSWYFDDLDRGLDRFPSEYGKMNPREDFAESFAARVATRHGRTFHGESPGKVSKRLTDRFAVLDEFFASLV